MRLSRMDKTLMLLTQLSEGDIEKERLSALETAKEAANIFYGVTVEGEDFSFSGDRELTVILLRNLIVNACRAGGDVRVVLTQNSFCISDTGCGMTEDEIARAFDPFYKADKVRTRKNGGAGLGLTIVRRISDLHGGQIIIKSQKGKGTDVIYNPDTSL